MVCQVFILFKILFEKDLAYRKGWSKGLYDEMECYLNTRRIPVALPTWQ